MECMATFRFSTLTGMYEFFNHPEQHRQSKFIAVYLSYFATFAGATLLAGTLVACQTERPGGQLMLTVEAHDAVAALQAINEPAQRCWHGTRAFRSYRIIPELDTHSGRPRILLVSATDAQGLPQLVIEAEGTPVEISTYGPLTQRSLSSRINTDIARWSGGKQGCGKSG